MFLSAEDQSGNFRLVVGVTTKIGLCDQVEPVFMRHPGESRYCMSREQQIEQPINIEQSVYAPY